MEGEPHFGRLVRERRRALDLTQDELARRVGCAPVTVRKIEYGDMRPSAQVAERLAMALAVPPDERPAFVRQARAVRRGERPRQTSPLSPYADAPPFSPAELSGRSIRGYQLGPQLGQGGFGAVYRATQPLVEREVAVKIILPQYADHPDFIRRFEVEAQLVARLEHPHIVPLYDYWREPGAAFLVMRYLRGGSLLQRLEAGPPPAEDTLRLIEQLCAALYTAHRAGVVHRDLKPANILLDEDGNAYLGDFGIAKDLHRHADLSFAGAFVGSPAYSSPEQLRAEPVTPQTDIYALGVLLYELLTGQKPFAGVSPALLAQQHLSAPVPRLEAARPGLAPALDQIVQRALAKVPAARYGDVRELALALRSALTGEPMAPGRPGGQPLHAASPTVILDLEDDDNPYPGLRAFGEADAARFFGRASLTQQLLVRLGETGELARFLAVVGPSGSGKSSVVRAGLLPSLRAGGLPDSEKWLVATLLPGVTPLARLADALWALAPRGVDRAELFTLLAADSRGLLRAARRVLPVDGRAELLLVIDQFEELFTFCPDEAERAHLLDSLVTAVLDERSRLRVVVTLRADMLDRALQYVDFGELVRQRGELVLPLTPDELEQAIVGPARRAGLALEDGLEAELLGAVAAQPGALPLLQHTLRELFLRREGRVLSRAAYQALGGVSGALAASAEAVYVALDAAGQAGARQLFLRLVMPGEGTDDARRRARLDELQGAGVPPETVEAFAAARLLTFDRDSATREPTVEVAHEALLRAWPRLRRWIEEAREALLVQRRLAEAAMEWMRGGQDASFLASGARLAQFETLHAHSVIALSGEERAYLEAGLSAQAAREAADQARQANELAQAQALAEEQRRRAELAQAAVEIQGQQAERMRALAVEAQTNLTRAEAQRLAAEANRLLVEGGNAEVIALLALRSLALQYTPQGDAAVTGAARLLLPGFSFSGHTGPVRAALYLRDSRHAVTGSDDLTARLWDLHQGRELRRFTGHQARIYALALSTDEALLATACYDGVARLYTVARGELRHELRGHAGQVWGVAFSLDGTRLYTGALQDQTVRVWDTTTGAQLRVVTAPEPIQSLARSPDGRLLAAGLQDGRIVLLDTTSWEPTGILYGHTDTVWKLDFAPDGARLLSGSTDKTARIWDVSSGEQRIVLRGHTNFVDGVAFSPDGRFALTGSQDQTARLWDAASGAQLALLNGHTNLIRGVAYAPDGRSVITVSFDHTAKVWRLPAHPDAPPFAGHTSSVRRVLSTPDGRWIVSASYDGTARIWDAASGRERHRLAGDPLSCDAVALTPDGQRLLTGGMKGVARLWELESGAELRHYQACEDGITAIAIAPDGATFAAASYSHRVSLLRWGDSGPSMVLQHDGDVFGLAYAPDGRTILSGAFDRSARLWDSVSGAPLRRFSVPPDAPEQVGVQGDGASSVAFAPDGRTIATGSWGGPIWLWDVESGALLRKLPGHRAFVWSVVFSTDGAQLLSAGADGTARLWDVASGEELRRFSGHVGTVYSAVFAPDGRTVITGADDGRLLTWDVAIDSCIAGLSARLLRGFTADEQAQFGVSEPPSAS